MISIAFGDPYVLGKLPVSDGAIAVYAGLRKSEEAAARVLIGISGANGTLPVTILGMFKRGEGMTLLPARGLGN